MLGLLLEHTLRYFLHHRSSFLLRSGKEGKLRKSPKYWGETEDNPEALGDYVEEMERISNIISSCAANECVIRMGWGSGFRFMTGDWQGNMTEDDYCRLVKSIRPKHPEDLIFPKTTRFINGGMPLGFIKMSF